MSDVLVINHCKKCIFVHVSFFWVCEKRKLRIFAIHLFESFFTDVYVYLMRKQLNDDNNTVYRVIFAFYTCKWCCPILNLPRHVFKER